MSMLTSRLIVAAIAVFVLLGFIYSIHEIGYKAGKEDQTKVMQSLIDQYEDDADKAKAKVVEVEKVVTKTEVVFKDRIIYKDKQTSTVKQEIVKNETDINNGCTVSASFVRLHDFATEGYRAEGTGDTSVSGESNGSTEEAKTYSCSEVLNVIVDNYDGFKANAIQLEELQNAIKAAEEKAQQ